MTHTCSPKEFGKLIGRSVSTLQTARAFCKLNYKRGAFNALIEEVELGRVRHIVIAHRDRLVHFSYGWFEGFCQRHHTEIVIIDGEHLSPEQELVRDVVAIITVFASRLHRLRSYTKEIRDAALQKDQNRAQ